MHDEIMVSISCLTYNHGKYIRDALEGFVNQICDFKYEVLVHDDASNDDTVQIIKEYESKYPDIIKPIYQLNNQYSQSISIKQVYQIPRINSKYVAVCEGDDYWIDPYKLQKQVDFLESNFEYTLCATSCIWKNLRDNIDEKQFLIEDDRDVSLSEIIIERNGRIFPTCSILIRSDIYLSIPHWMTVFPVGDIAVFINAGINGKIRMLSDVTCVYRWFTEGSWTSRVDNEENKIEFKNRFIKGFEALNTATSYKYNDAINERISKEKFDINLLSRNWKNIQAKSNKEIWKKLSLSSKINIFFRCRFPMLHKILVSNLRRIKK